MWLLCIQAQGIACELWNMCSYASSKILQSTRSLTNWIPAKSSTHVLLVVDIVHSMETIFNLKICIKIYGLSGHMTHSTNQLSVKVKLRVHKKLCFTVKILKASICKGWTCVLECIKTYAGESDSAPVGIGLLRYSQCFLTHITGVCVCMSYKFNNFVSVIVFHLDTQFTIFYYWF